MYFQQHKPPAMLPLQPLPLDCYIVVMRTNQETYERTERTESGDISMLHPHSLILRISLTEEAKHIIPWVFALN